VWQDEAGRPGGDVVVKKTTCSWKIVMRWSSWVWLLFSV
jgi:hypothetical protein